jgi:D-beta-D-heptose 7-phosphate kinase/D-beta-D-heptose 1-phosphate adenosyltransferase
MDKERLIRIIDQFKDKKIMVIGDIMLDKYVIGDVSRISPEAPVPVVKVKSEGYAPGGASNVANNVSSLGGKPLMVGIVGKDNTKDILFREFGRRKIDTEGVFEDDKRPTVEKVRVLAMGQQLLRFDYEKTDGPNKEIEKKIIDFIKQKIDDIDAVIVSDYAKGLITATLMDALLEIVNSKKKILIIDPKPKNIGIYKGATVITPNHKEAFEITNIEDRSDEDMLKIGKILQDKLDSEILITRGERGMTLFEKDGKVTHIPTKAKEVYEVSGAGDTVVATFTLALASGAATKEAAFIANNAAGITVGKVGTTAVSIAELKESLENE